jgi:hypothetical protein
VTPSKLSGSFWLRFGEKTFAFLDAPAVRIASLFINTAGDDIPTPTAVWLVEKSREHLVEFTWVGNTKRQVVFWL